MNRLVKLSLVALVLLAPACSQRGFYSNLDIEARAVPGIDYSPYKTWRFAREDEYPATGNATLDDPKFRSAVSKSTIDDMDKLGYTKVDRDPDFVLMLHVVTESKFDEQKMADIYKGYDMAWAQMGPNDYWQEGTLIIFAMDAKTGKQVWSSTAKAKLDDQSNFETKKDRFQKVVSMMLEDFPKRQAK